MKTVSIPAEAAVVPVANVYCIGRNYAEHASELNNPVPGEPVVFLKTTASLRSLAGGAVAFAGETFHHEAELVLLIGKTIPLGASGDWSAVRALGLGLDLTRREVQAQLKAKGLPWAVAKSFAGSGVLSEFIPRARFADPDRIHFTFAVNGALRQTGDTRDLLFKVPTVLTYLAQHQELGEGDLVFTGTPKGVGPLRVGDRLDLAFPDLEASFSGVL
jgi:2-keto-4-pentenoate hydratase/2-oxohepta-3-ene-1,7-dioic acid hydratase in catechol pathway